MAEPARKTSRRDHGKPDPGGYEDESSGATLLRWVERPDGRLELLELPLTPELFLDPQLEDTMVQGRLHSDVRHFYTDLLRRHLHSDPDVMVLDDVKHLLGPDLPGPAPDVSVIRRARNPARDLESFDTIKQGVVPCLVIEILSPRDARVRRTDEVDKAALYEKIGVSEYVMVDLPRPATGHRFRLKELRLDAQGRYQPIPPDGQGRLLSETTQLLFGVTAAGDWVEVFDARTGERLLSSLEEAAARKAAEQELQKLRAEIERLKSADPRR